MKLELKVISNILDDWQKLDSIGNSVEAGNSAHKLSNEIKSYLNAGISGLKYPDTLGLLGVIIQDLHALDSTRAAQTVIDWAGVGSLATTKERMKFAKKLFAVDKESSVLEATHKSPNIRVRAEAIQITESEVHIYQGAVAEEKIDILIGMVLESQRQIAELLKLLKK